jgi:inhibitor of cysteine peptidase
MDGYIKTALVICMAATVLASGTIVYAHLRGVGTEFPDTGSVLSSFSDYDELEDYLTDATYVADESDYYFLSGGQEAAMGDSSYSTTNVQVSGVDEQDIVKTNGDHIFVASYNGISIIAAYPPNEMELVSQLSISDVIPFKTDDMSVHISGLYLADDRLVVLASVYMGWWTMYEGDVFVGYPVDLQRAYVSVFDISDPSEPDIELSYGVSGYSLTSRMVGDVVYVISQAYVWGLDEGLCVPHFWDESESHPIEPDQIYYDPNSTTKDSFVSLLAMDIASAEYSYMSVIAGYASTIYMSTDALYLTFQKWGGHILLVDSETVPEDEDSTRTTIHKISTDGLSMLPVARGDVKGWLLNQFSMDEKDDMLRVTTTTSWVEPENGVYVLNSTLSVIGSIEGLAPTERIYSARFLGDTLYLVTFLQIDPLFVIDLSTPTSPKVLGELEVPGFSTYLHPVGDDHVLGIGRIGDHVKLTLFDVSNPAFPVEKDTYIVSEMSWTTASYDHKAVLFDLERELLVIPMTTYYYSPVDGMMEYTSSAYVFSLTVEGGISLRGTVEHGDYVYYNGVERSLYIEDSLYTLSMTMLKANSLDDLSEEGSIVFDSYYARR